MSIRPFKPLWDVAPDLPQTHFLDNRIYTDEAVFSREEQDIFRSVWKFACHESEIDKAGDYRVVEIGGISLFVVRDVDSKVRAFINACPHRGAMLLRDASGSLARHHLKCFYHHWIFSTNGQCLSIPRPNGYEGTSICKEKISLREVRVASAHGLVFINLSDDGEPLLDFLDGALNSLAEPLADLEVIHYHRVVVNANWKLFVETNCEGYHELLHHLNRTTALSQPEYGARHWHLHSRGHHVFEPAKIAYSRLALGERGNATLPGMSQNGHIVVDLFPDVMVNVRATVVRIDSLTPISPGVTVLECRGLGRRDDTSELRELRLKHHNQVWGPFGRNLPEDIWAIETQWKNMSAGAVRYSVVAREEDHQATDDAPLRSFYSEWCRRLKVSSHNIDEQYLEADDAMTLAAAKE